MPELPHPVIAIDGTAASGKSTFSRRLAQRLGFVYVNTGAMYRGVTWYLQDKGVELTDAEAVARGVAGAKIEMLPHEGELVFHIDGIDPLPHLREGRVNEGVSLVAQVVAVRQLLVAAQQSWSRSRRWSWKGATSAASFSRRPRTNFTLMRIPKSAPIAAASRARPMSSATRCD